MPGEENSISECFGLLIFGYVDGNNFTNLKWIETRFNKKSVQSFPKTFI
ncbi:hypothetical protein EV200_11077 [Pedobacter psychrotolerans]|uniref:Uncharacterized protein n=1 Tax=Pedobacter psychrotolerans TaxID=1843235 RepID=A0A4R2H367_9SPHI|nr:hypothetical protein EV200_11077 [Pedobacter psychrotolerans]